MALNIGRRAAKSKTEPTPESAAAEVAAPAVIAAAESVAPAEPESTAVPAPKPRARRTPAAAGTGTPTGRGRSRKPAAEPEALAPEAVVEPAPVEPEPEPEAAAPVPEVYSTGYIEVIGEADAPGDEGQPLDGADDGAPGRRRRRGRGGRGGRGGAGRDNPPVGLVAGSMDAPEAVSFEQGGPDEPEQTGEATLSDVKRSLDYHNRQIERLVRMQEDLARRLSATGNGAGQQAAPVANRQRVGIFVDSANIELALDRTRNRIDWKRVLELLCRDRVLIKAIAYSPVHDDPAVSIETQRFVEPFLDSGFKVVTKPLKRFADGSIKANIDVELAMDVMTMVDRLDVVVLVSGDGDFQRLVEVTQAKGVRVEVASVQSSTASNLRYASDHFYDLGRVPTGR